MCTKYFVHFKVWNLLFLQKFRESNVFGKEMISRNFCEKMEAAKFRNYHTAHCIVDFTKFLYHDFLKNFRENNFLLKILLYNWFHEIIFKCHGFFAKIPSNQRFTKEFYYKLIWRKKICMAANFSFFYTVCATLNCSTNKIMEINAHIFWKNFVKATVFLNKEFTKMYMVDLTKYFSVRRESILFFQN